MIGEDRKRIIVFGAEVSGWGTANGKVRRMIKAGVAVAAICGLPICVCYGQLVINVGTFTLLPDTGNQVVELFISNTGSGPVSVDALSLNVQVADGGPEVGAILDDGAHIRGPHITAVDMLSGTAFQALSGPGGQSDTGSAPQLALYSTIAPHGTVSLAPGRHRLALITLDTTGPMDPGPWDFSLGNTVAGPTTYYVQGSPAIIPTILDGSLALTPDNAVTYTLLPGSRMLDDWSNGGPSSVEAPMTGTFELLKLPSDPPFEVHQITNISFAVGFDPSNPIYELRGHGEWQFGGDGTEVQDASLEVSFAGRSSTLTNADRTITQPWPIIDFTVNEVTVHPGNPSIQALTNTVTLRIVAAPLLRFTSILPDPGTGGVHLTWLPAGFTVRLERATSASGPYIPIATNLNTQAFTDTTAAADHAETWYRLRLQ